MHCGHRLPEESLYLHRPGTPRAGDCVAPRTILEAVLEGRRADGDRAADQLPAACPDRDRQRPMSGAGRYRHLFTPLRLGPLTVRNRIVFSAHLTNYANDGLPTEQHAAYYAARAAGGAGLIITEEHSTHPTDWPYEKLIHGFHPAVIPGYRRITEAVHAHDVPIFAQINHNGGQASSMYSRLPVWAPSPVPDPLFREVPKAVEPHEIAEIVAGYAHGRRALHGRRLRRHRAAVLALVDRARLPLPRHQPRTDAYGGSLATRARLLLEIVAAVREAIGPDQALGVRLCGDELIEGGTTIDDAVAVARMVEATGQVDYINTSIGVATATLYMIEASMHPARLRPVHPQRHPPGGRPAGGRRRPVQGPAPGRPGPGRRPLRPGRGGPRPDRRPRLRGQGPVGARHRHPDLPVLQPGVRRPDGPEPVARLHREPPHRPGGGRSRRRRRRGRRVVVVGGGPGGLQAAVTAAQRGHQVTLLERQPAPAARSPWPRPCQPGRVPRHRAQPAAECQRNGVEIRTGVAATAQWLRGEDPTRWSWPPEPARRRRGGPAAAAGGRRPRRARGPGRAGRARGRGRRARLPPGDLRRRAAGRPGLRRGDRHQRHGRRPGPRHHPRPGDLERASAAKGIGQATDLVPMGAAERRAGRRPAG